MIERSFMHCILVGTLAMSACSRSDPRFAESVTISATADDAGRVTTPQIKGAYVDLADIRMYYEIAGSGAPIVFLHGGFGSSDTWGAYFPLLAQTYSVITPDSRGQGRTTIGRGPISYGRMASDAVRLLDHLEIEKAHFVGFSDGGCTVLHLLVDYPDRIASATLIGTPYHTDNYPTEVFAALKKMIAGIGEDERRRASYATNAPEPDAWPELIRRLGRTWLTQPTFSDDELGLIETPTLIVKVDRDQFLPPAVFDRLADLIPGARVLHLPEGTHSVPSSSPRRWPTESGPSSAHFRIGEDAGAAAAASFRRPPAVGFGSPTARGGPEAGRA